MKISEQKVTVEFSVPDFTNFRKELVELLGYYSQDEYKRKNRWKEIDHFLFLKLN